MTEEATNVRHLRLASKQDTTPTTDQLQQELDALDPDKRELVLSVASAAKFLLDNRNDVDYYILLAYSKNSDGEPAHHIMVAPTDVSNIAMGLRILDNWFSSRLNIGYASPD